MTAFDLDNQIDDMLVQKKGTSDAVLSTFKDQAVVCNDGAPKISVLKLLRSILVPNSVPAAELNLEN
jgi:hypothetical protein